MYSLRGEHYNVRPACARYAQGVLRIVATPGVTLGCEMSAAKCDFLCELLLAPCALQHPNENQHSDCRNNRHIQGAKEVKNAVECYPKSRIRNRTDTAGIDAKSKHKSNPNHSPLKFA